MISKIKHLIKNSLAYLKWFFTRPAIGNNDHLLLHIGCGEIYSPEFINIDARPLPHIHLLKKHLFRFPEFKNDTVELIYMCHVLEHVKMDGLLVNLKELHRILKPGGVLRISVPDFDKIIDIYNKTNRDIDSIRMPLMGGQDYKFNFHYSIFNNKYLSKLLVETGFKEIREWDPYNCLYHDFQDWASSELIINNTKYPISLNIEAVK